MSWLREEHLEKACEMWVYAYRSMTGKLPKPVDIFRAGKVWAEVREEIESSAVSETKGKRK